MATATIANTKVTGVGNQHSVMGHINRDTRMEVGYLTFDGGDYVTGGIAWDLETFEADDAEFIGFEVTTTGYAACYNRTTHKVMVWNGTTEHAQSAISLVFRYIAFGKH